MIRDQLDDAIEVLGLRFFTVGEEIGWAIADLVAEYGSR